MRWRHELATNAAKYGAFAQEAGHLVVAWQIETHDGRRIAVITWKETGVSLSPAPPRRSGYGRELIERALPFQLGAKTRLDFEPDGVRCSIMVSLSEDADEG